MSADNCIRIRKKENGKYQVRHESASSLMHALAEVEPTPDELLLHIIADDVDGYENAMKVAQEFLREVEEEGGEVEYGVVDENWKK